MASPEPTVTIHRGELAQIKRLITKSDSQKPTRGQLYGLWTHSFQPVIQIVVGLPETKPKRSNKSVWEEYFSKCDETIKKSHGLSLLGEWRGAAPTKGSADFQPPVCDWNRYVNMSFKMEGEKLIPVGCVVKRGEHQQNQRGKLEILPGQSSFRLYKNLTKELKTPEHVECDVSPVDVTEEDRAAIAETERGLVQEAEVKEDQWYSTERGMEILRFLYQNLQIHFQVLETSRNTETHNIGFSLLYTAPRGEQSIRLEFPADFPKSAATLIRDGKETPVHISENESEQQPEELSQVTCTTVVSLLEQPQYDKPGTTADAVTDDVDMSDTVTRDRSQKEQSTKDTANVVVSTEKETHMAGNQEMANTGKEKKATKRGSGLAPVEDVEPRAPEHSARLIGDTPEFPNGSGSNIAAETPTGSKGNTTEENSAGSKGNTTKETIPEAKVTQLKKPLQEAEVTQLKKTLAEADVTQMKKPLQEAEVTQGDNVTPMEVDEQVDTSL